MLTVSKKSDSATNYIRINPVGSEYKTEYMQGIEFKLNGITCIYSDKV